ncbi:type I pantothenate kinase [Ligilactobacillus ceti]|uniref:Pantothenate kinase n=1 Tax=Ligilactobacillus ceti DSM 22408 TaxID=1122146 RepID=A0A0R2KG25_9LACO|nr:type I pantothenate kinase [Ligilactobacillus ceti]KRN88368.1 pantothenate kinase [Ligilactobacillus ceti DSM 22408]
MQEKMNYYQITRETWRDLDKEEVAPLTPKQLLEIKSLNDRISDVDVNEVYLPLVYWLGQELQLHQELQRKKATFLKIQPKKVPFIIGIAGSVAVGKSTTARLMQTLLSKVYPDKQVELMTTDGFLYPNQVLTEKGILDKKGFPESYDMKLLINFINTVKNGELAQAPVYSHEIYDIVPGKMQEIYAPDILIVEGINVLQLPSHEQIYVSDFFDFSIYVDAPEELIETWYLERFIMLLELAKQDPTNYYYELAQGSQAQAIQLAQKVWHDINHKNLIEFILPTRNRADLILKKGENHLVNELLFRKY